MSPDFPHVPGFPPEWNGASTYAQLKGKYYWGAQPVAYYIPGGAVQFEHQDWLGTERMRTTYNGGVQGSFTSLPFGDSQPPLSDTADANHYATLDHDTESDTDHAQFRQYSNIQGHWLSPDPYGGSYDISNPQSFNRYASTGNSPLANVDPSGLMVPISAPIPGTGGGCLVCIEQQFQAYNGGLTQANGGYFGSYGSEFDLMNIPIRGDIGTYVDSVWEWDRDETVGSGLDYLMNPPTGDGIAVLQAQNSGGNYNGNSTSPWLQPPTGQCATIFNNYESAADRANGQAWVNFWGQVAVGAAVGGWGGTLKSFIQGLIGGIVGGVTVLKTADTSRQDISTLYNSANSEWQAAGCGSSMYNKYD